MIDLNCDMGESYGRWSTGADSAVMPLITSANIACGAHAGDPSVLRATIELARWHGVAVGAHPSYPDLQGFGRRAMSLTPAEVEDWVLYQIGAVYAFTRAAGVELAHVKPHGALYNHAAKHQATADAIARAVASFDRALILVALAGSELAAAGAQHGLLVAHEAFADRAYEPDGTLRSRHQQGAVYSAVDQIVAQAISIARDGYAVSHDGRQIEVTADTLCLHGDTPHAAMLAGAIRAGLRGVGVPVVPLREVLAAPR